MPDEELRPGEDPQVEEAVHGYLADHSVVTLAVADGDGPWGAAVFFAHRDFDLYFVTGRQTRHGAALAADPRCGGTVQEHPTELLDIRGVQLAGRATVLSPDERAAAFELYAAKFPLTRPLYDPAEGAWRIAGRRVEEPFWRLAATDVYWIDNRHGFGRRRHLRLAAESAPPRLEGALQYIIDLDAATAAYCAGLGLRLARREGDRAADLRGAGGGLLELRRAAAPEELARIGRTAAVFRVASLEAALLPLARAGFRLLGRQGGREAVFADADGNTLVVRAD